MSKIIDSRGSARKPVDSAQVHRLEKLTHEAIGVTRRVLAKVAPHYAWLLAGVKIKVRQGLIAATDGKSIFVGPEFLEQQGHRMVQNVPVPGTREVIMVHEMLHMARCHAQRMQRMQSRQGMPFRPGIIQLVADAIVNEDIKGWHGSSLVVPKEAFHHHMLQESVAKICKRMQIPVPKEVSDDVSQHSMEQIHDAVDAVMQKHEDQLSPSAECPCCGGTSKDKEKGSSSSGESPEGDEDKKSGSKGSDKEKGSSSSGESPEGDEDRKSGSKGSDKAKGDGSQSKESGSKEGKSESPKNSKGPGDMAGSGSFGPKDLRRLWKQTKSPEDLLKPPASDCSDEALEAQEREWQAKINQAESKFPGSTPGEALSSWSRTKVDVNRWKRALSPILQRFLAPRTGYNHRVPARSMIAGSAAGIPAPFEPAVQQWTPGGALGICIDSSGSVSDRHLEQFLNRTFAIARNFSSPVHLVIGDTQVEYSAADIDEAPQKALKHLSEGAPGRGGTAFGPLIEEAQELRSDVVLYLTDGYADFPQPKPNIPIVWAVLPNGLSRSQFPYGHVLQLDLED